MSVQEDLKTFYNAEAIKYGQTREKHRSEEHLFLDILNQHPGKTLRILEFGCGSGRLLKALTTLTNKKITYVGVDLSKELLKLAKKQVKPSHKHLSCTFVCEDIVSHISGYKQESCDFVVGVASFQHIPTVQERLYLLKNIYRILRYEGGLLMTNRSFSHWFLQTYQKAVSAARGRYLLSFGKKDWKDILVPWRSAHGIAHRFYHIFTIKELRNLLLLS